MTEGELLAAILELAKVRGWLAYHPLPARVRKRGIETYRTQASGDGKGFPDCVLVPLATPAWTPPRGLHEGAVEFWELKDEMGQLDPDQIIWRDRLLAVGAVYRLVRPSDWTSGRVAEWLA